MRRLIYASILAIAAAAVPAAAQQRALTADDYARAERFLSSSTTPLVLRSGVRPAWLRDGRFWYRVTTETGSEAFLVDPVKGTKVPCDLPECQVRETGGRGGAAAGQAAPRNDIPSPDGTRTVFVRAHNLWVRDVATKKETQLTTDGVKDFAYATNNAGWTKSDRPIVLWSPDSKKIATFQHDGRQVGEMYLVDVRVGHPHLQAWKYPLPGDEHIFMLHRVVIDVEEPKVVRLKMDPDPHRSTLCDHIVCRGGDWADVQWSADSSRLAFVSTSRDHKHEQLFVTDASSGEVRKVLEETVETFFESGNGRVNWRVLFPSNEVIWFSERDNWGQLYLYDLGSGSLKHQITTGEGNVTQLLRVDEQARQLVFQAVGKEKGRDPYFTHLYRIGMDGRNLTLLTPEDATHDISLADSGAFFVDSYSTPTTPPVALLRDADGKLVLTLERADITKLTAAGWKPPVPIKVKARDGTTDLYGLMYQPANLDESRKYPIINRVYPGPQTGSVGGRSFSPSRSDSNALAALGFVVVEIDGMGTPWRSKKFHEAYYGNMADNTIPDQVAGMKQLAERHPWIDLTRAGVWGHSGGGYATASAMFMYPDFFKVGISESGNHDNRVYEDDWAEKWTGLLTKNPDGTSNYDSQATQAMAKNLKGKLLLAHGTMDSNVPPNNTLLVVDALIKANKDFDLLMIPNAGHGYGSAGNYMTRRRWDYFVKHLMGAEPPKEYQLGTLNSER
ncbi:MAG TPA: DPP IV N-terminal domain-containing protein [Vicinamibacterales bacterium]|nr:DPP IV N-terminal domain-containing protein [Vicinamibacterales bacterium]